MTSLLLALALSAPSAGCGTSHTGGAVTVNTIKDGANANRTVEIEVPSGYVASTPLPLVIGLHGASATISDAKTWQQPFVAYAPMAAGSLIVYPQGINLAPYGVGWDTGGWSQGHPAGSCDGRDLVLFENIIAYMKANYCVDTTLVFMGGYSWGADDTFGFACCRPTALRGILPSNGDEVLDGNPSCASVGSSFPAVRFTYATNDAYSQAQFDVASSTFRTDLACPGSFSSLADNATGAHPGTCKTYTGCAKPAIECVYPNLGHTPPENYAASSWAFIQGFAFAATATPTTEATGIVYALSVAGAPAGTSKVQWRLDDHDLYDSGNRIAPISTPYSVARWHSRNVLDGPHWFAACAFDASGASLGCTPDVTFTVDNGPPPNPAGATTHGTLSLTAPANPDATLSGTVTTSIASTGYAGSVAYTCSLDGMRLDGVNFTKFATGSTSWSMDTTKWPDGSHLLYCYATAGNSNHFASYTRRLTFGNGHVARSLTAGYSELHLNAGETAQLAPSMLYTDNTSSAVTPSAATYTSQNATIATVSSSGVVTAQGVNGIALITVSYSGKSTSVFAFSHADRTKFAHLGKDGAIHQTYDAANSMWLRNMFWSWHQTQFVPGRGYTECAPYVRPGYPAVSTCQSTLMAAAGLNVITDGFYPGTACNSSSWATLKAAFDNQFWTMNGSIGEWLGSSGFNYNPGGLYVFYDAGNMNNAQQMQDILNVSGTCPGAARLVQYAMEQIKGPGRGVAFNSKDEIDGAWGDTPFPNDGRWVAPYGVPDTAFATQYDILNGGTVLEPSYTRASRLPMTNAIISIATSTSKINWQKNNTTADFNEVYWTHIEYPEPWGQNGSLPEWLERIDAGLRAYSGSVQPMNDMKFDAATVVKCDSNLAYTKMDGDTSASEYRVEKDALRYGGFAISPVLSACPWYVAARGGAGVHYYTFEAIETGMGRAASPGYPGKAWDNVDQEQTGTNWRVGPDRWNSMSASLNLIKTLEPYLLQPPTHAPDLGPYVITGARKGQGGVGNILIVLNANNTARTLTVPLSAHSAGKTQLTRYRVLNSASSSTSLAITATDAVTVAPGEAVVYVFSGTGTGTGSLTAATSTAHGAPRFALSGDATQVLLSTILPGAAIYWCSGASACVPAKSPSTRYSAPLTISSGQTVCGRVWKSNDRYPIACSTYTVN